MGATTTFTIDPGARCTAVQILHRPGATRPSRRILLRRIRPRRLRLVGLALLGLAGGCLEREPRPARWGYIHAAIIEPACTTSGCHSSVTAIAGVNLTGREGAYTILTGRICGEPIKPQDPPRNYVTPFAAEYSTLIHQLRGEERDVMPPDSPLPDAEIELVARWIDAGAACD